MSTNEEYLDGLLKSLSNSDENSVIDQKPSISDNKQEQDNSISELEDLLASLDELNNLDETDHLEASAVPDNAVGVDDSNESYNIHNDELIDFMDENRDVTELLDTMEGDDELAEINALLKKSDNNELVDDDMLALLESVSDDSNSTSSDFSEDFDIFAMESMEEFHHEQDNLSSKDEEIGNSEIDALLQDEATDSHKKSKHRKVKKEKTKKENARKRNESEEQENVIGNNINEIQDLDFLNGEPPKKQGFLKRFFGSFLEEEMEVAETILEEIAEDDNMAILKAMEEEDNKESKKGKNKKDKKNKKEKGKNTKLSDDDDDEEIDNKKGKTKKKEKKVKNIIPEEPSKKIPIKKMVPIFIISFTFMAIMILLSSTIPNMIELKSARNAYYNKDYKVAYEELSGKELNKSDQIIFQKANLVMQLQRKWNSYENFTIMNKKLEALNALLQGASRYNELLVLSEEYSVVEEFTNIYNEIMDELKNTYQLTEDDIKKIILYEDPITYSKVLQSIIAGTGPNIPLNTTTKNGSNASGTEIIKNTYVDNVHDVLVQEEDILDQLKENTNSMKEVSNENSNEPGIDQSATQNAINGDKELFYGEVKGKDGSIIVPNDISR
ncbi:MAG TPA: hypothetical protein VJZ04_03210 [Lachnospiraceae bacterium]|nr:hypothetical protein [Lachnospiraceae bacterium]